jgi:hypothetical protein
VTLRPELAGLRVADPPERWAALGFAVTDGRVELGGVTLELGGDGREITGWTLRHAEAGEGDIDGLPTRMTLADPPAHVEHPNGAIRLDHVVIVTPHFDRTAAALAARGMELRRERQAGEHRQGFRRLGPSILELVSADAAPLGPARFWGLVVVAADLPALRERLSPHLGEIKAAVQPGRHIATLAPSAGLGPRVAFMDPEPPS